MLLPLLLARDEAPTSIAGRAAGALLLALGAAIYAWCAWDFARHGRGTPFPLDAPKRLVIRGPYRHVRNPMYLGVLTAILGWAAWFGSPALALYAAGVGLMFHGMVGLYEEPRLAREFGAAYAEYWARVPRWLPRTRPRLNRG